MALGQASLQQALALALKYSCPKWELNFVYANSLLLHWQHSPATVVPLVRQVFPALMEQPYGTVHQLLLCTWPELQVLYPMYPPCIFSLLPVPLRHLLLASCTLGACSSCFVCQPCIYSFWLCVHPCMFSLHRVPSLNGFMGMLYISEPMISTWPRFCTCDDVSG